MNDDLHVEPAPPPAPRPLSALERKLARIADELPSGTDARIATLGENHARVLTSQLRNGRRAPKRPPGTWVFTARRIDDGPDAGKFGVWAHVTPDTPTS